MEPRKDANYEVEITSPAGIHISLEATDYDTAHSAVKSLLDSTKDDKLREMIDSCMRSFGFMGSSHGDYVVHISASLPRTDTGEKQTCGRRMTEVGPWDHKEDLDTWELRGKDKCCSFCGSLHPDRVLELAREHGTGIIGFTDKGYKWYVTQPNVPNAAFGGIKYYRQHDTQEFIDELNKLINAEKTAKAA